MAHVYSAPADAAEFFAQDGGFVYNLVRKNLGPEFSSQDAEDVAANIFERLLKSKNDQGHTVLEQYSAAYVSARTNKPVTWRGFLSHKVLLHVRGQRESLARRNGRELLICDAEAGDGGDTWVTLFGGQIWDEYPSLTDEQFEQRMRDYLATLPAAWDGPGSLLVVFNEILERIKSGEKPTKLAGLSRKEISRALARLREVAAEALKQPARGPVVVEGVSLSLAEVRDALDRLQAARGNHVHRALAGHRLMTEGPKGWYHAYARAVLKAYPEASVDALAGKVGGAGAGHVKEAVTFGLQQLLAGAPEEPGPTPLAKAIVEAAPAPPLPEELTRAEVLESELWKLTGMDAAKIDAIIAVAEKVYGGELKLVAA